ncbi:urease accessory protein UreE [Devosia limi DSM 17137]|uniref:Urease accessory protein UreE n=1 Tax=Devosia limi DSM 17137 TaxID=1121477 RepID=A0A0F5LRN2_9HYPH|nr:urease accessory protein UreE [Devosia limi]KKB84961.1 urease accessory protein UreE [Devosia limi DSM 17137]SHF03703.1 urease accessory protein [Devosia limi DSM 17137]
MFRAVAHLPANHQLGTPFDTIVLAHDERRLRRKLLTLRSGAEVMVDFPQTVTLDHRGALQLDDGRLIEIAAAAELLYEVRGRDPAHLVRLAWHIGNRHTAAQLEENRILIKRDHVLKTMLEGLNASVSNVTEPFFAEHGAYHSHADAGHALLQR